MHSTKKFNRSNPTKRYAGYFFLTKYKPLKCMIILAACLKDNFFENFCLISISDKVPKRIKKTLVLNIEREKHECPKDLSAMY